MNKTVKSLALISGGIFVALIVALCGQLAPTLYSRAIHNWGAACHAFDVQDLPSPEDKWIARIQHVGCGDIDGSRYIEVVLVRNSWFPLFASEHQIFIRELTRKHDSLVEPQWGDENNISLVAQPCLPVCHASQNGVTENAPAECEDWCEFHDSVKGVNIALVPSSDPADASGK